MNMTGTVTGKFARRYKEPMREESFVLLTCILNVGDKQNGSAVFSLLMQSLSWKPSV